MSKRTYVGNLPLSITTEELTTLFSKYGAVTPVFNKTDKKMGLSPGAVEMVIDEDEIDNLIKNLEGELDGKTHKKPFKGTDEELQAIIDWLGEI